MYFIRINLSAECTPQNIVLATHFALVKFQVIPKFEILMKSHHMNPSLTISSI